MDDNFETTKVMEPENKKSGSPKLLWLIPIFVIAGILIAFAFTVPVNENKELPETKQEHTESNIILESYETGTQDSINAFEQPIRQKWFQELRKINREEYKIIQSFAENKGLTEQQALAYFGLTTEQDIFNALPDPTENFSEIKFATERGGIPTELITPEIYKQPEFLPENTFQENGIKWWTQNNPSYWGTNGYGFYPAKQQTTVSLKNENSFSGWFIVRSSWGIQTWQGMKLAITNNTGKEFINLQLTPNEILLDPTFPKFGENWAHKIEFTGTISDNTPKGSYTIAVNPTNPSNENRNKWQKEHINLYFDAVSSGIKPGKNMLEITINVE